MGTPHPALTISTGSGDNTAQRRHSMATKKTVKDIAPKKTGSVKGGKPLA